MAPKKRKRTVQTAGSAPANSIRVKCPACEKEIPSFFVNSHLDLECPVLKKSCALPGIPAPSQSVREKIGCHAPSIDQLRGSSIRIDESIIQEDERTLASSVLEFDERKSSENKKDEDVATGIAAHKDCASYDGDVDNGDRDGGCARDIQSDMFRNHSVSLMDDDLENVGGEGNDPHKEHSQNARILLSSSSCQAVHQWAHRPSVQLGKPGDFAIVPGCFPSLPPPKVMAPKGLQVVEEFITPEVNFSSRELRAYFSRLFCGYASDESYCWKTWAREEEDHLLHCLDKDVSTPWKLSKVNGIHQGKAYGNHIYGDYKRVVSQANSPMPDFVLAYVKRMRDKVPALKEFFPNEMNSIDYCKGKGHYLKAHMDDRQLSGKILVNLSLAGGCFMTYTRELGLKEAYRVKLAPRSLQILTGESRYSYTHGIQRNDILDPRRVSMTFRQSVESPQNIRPSRLH